MHNFKVLKMFVQQKAVTHEKFTHCACTQVTDISNRPEDSVIEMVITNRDVNGTNPNGTSHPIHLHGHYFYVVDIGYPELNDDGQLESANENINCTDITGINENAMQKKFY